MKLNGVMLNSEEPARLAALYTAVLGEPSYHQDDWYGYETGAGSLMIGPHSEVHGRNADPARHMVALTTDGVDADCKRLKAAGVQFVEDPTDYGGLRIATLRDPEGNLVQLLQPRT